MLIAVSLLMGCGEKVYSVEGVYKEYQVEGEKSNQFQELRAACAKDSDSGDRESKACKVLDIVEIKIDQEETRAYFQNKNGK